MRYPFPFFIAIGRTQVAFPVFRLPRRLHTAYATYLSRMLLSATLTLDKAINPAAHIGVS